MRRTTASHVLPRPDLGPQPQSNRRHRPGSVIHGRYVLRGPACRRSFAFATARRVVRSSPANPSNRRRSWSLSARTLPYERSTRSSIFGMNGSISFGRMIGASTDIPRSLIRAYRRTVLGSTPAGWAFPGILLHGSLREELLECDGITPSEPRRDRQFGIGVRKYPERPNPQGDELSARQDPKSPPTTTP